MQKASHDRDRHQAPDRNHVSLSEDWEAQHWMDELKVTRSQLEKLINENGTSVATIRQVLGR